ncbi:uncharacterized protein LOC128743066 [Sabethes cyaneus]|uniref:uncharacterized protein LOC128743066 n=1 Tax=Sabethes cyaneus TaxID=53552 RepID=UPI00237D78F8|nr:uncharacterized protein LOC128743066 [Sabethes cyaneus]
MLFSFINFAVILVSLALVNPAVTEYKENLCLNGSRDETGQCICNEGFAEFQGNCFLSRTPTVSESHVRPRSNNFCPPGYSILNGRCLPTACEGTLCGSSCPPGYELKSGFCEIPNPNCPPGTSFQNGFCYFQPVTPKTETVKPIEKIEVVPPLRIDIPVPEYIDPLDPNEVDQGGDNDSTGIEPDRKPVNCTLPVDNTVNNVNRINSPTNTSTYNENNVYIHITRTKSNGAVKAVVIRNNETTVYEEKPPSKLPEEELNDDDSELSTEEPLDTTDRCCIVVSPRICRKQEPDEWVCFHRKHYRCGSFCTAEIVYLRPRRPFMKNSELLMPPVMGYSPLMRYGVCRWGKCPRIDCSGCLQGSYRCHTSCYTYDCAQQGGCHFVNQEEFCNEDKNDEICTPVN